MVLPRSLVWHHYDTIVMVRVNVNVGGGQARAVHSGHDLTQPAPQPLTLQDTIIDGEISS